MLQGPGHGTLRRSDWAAKIVTSSDASGASMASTETCMEQTKGRSGHNISADTVADHIVVIQQYLPGFR